MKEDTHLEQKCKDLETEQKHVKENEAIKNQKKMKLMKQEKTI